MDKTRDEITVAPDPGREEHARREKAAEFLASHEDISFTYEEERAVLRRIDSRVLPLILGAYFFQQLDKSTLRYAITWLSKVSIHPGRVTFQACSQTQHRLTKDLLRS